MVWLLEFGEYWPFIGGLALSVRRIFGPSSVVWLLVFEEYLALHQWSGSWCSENIWAFIGGLALGVWKILALHR
jgi:hypothetical protein